jgi:SLA1 homology domain 1, SHD1
MKTVIKIYVALFLFLPFAEAIEVRMWTDLQGRKVEATLTKLEGTSVILKLKNGNELPYPLDKLSVEDRKYVEGALVFLADSKKVLTEDKPTKPSEIPKITELLNFDSPWPERITFSEDPLYM